MCAPLTKLELAWDAAESLGVVLEVKRLTTVSADRVYFALRIKHFPAPFINHRQAMRMLVMSFGQYLVSYLEFHSTGTIANMEFAVKTRERLIAVNVLMAGLAVEVPLFFRFLLLPLFMRY